MELLLKGQIKQVKPLQLRFVGYEVLSLGADWRKASGDSGTDRLVAAVWCQATEVRVVPRPPWRRLSVQRFSAVGLSL